MKLPFEWANYDKYLSTDYELLLATMKSGMAIVAFINDEDRVQVVQGVFYQGTVDFRTQGVSYLTLFEDQLGTFNEWCAKKGVRWFIPCDLSGIDLEQELHNCQVVLGRQTVMLERIAEALIGDSEPSHGGLPEIATTLKRENAALVADRTQLLTFVSAVRKHAKEVRGAITSEMLRKVDTGGSAKVICEVTANALDKLLAELDGWT